MPEPARHLSPVPAEPDRRGDSDALTVARVLDGDVDAYQILVTRHQNAIFACAWQILRNRAEAEECAQEAFVQAYLKLRNLREPRFFMTWTWRICSALAVKQLRRSRKIGVTANLDRAASRDRTNPAEIEERDRKILLALSKLPEDQRQILTLRYWEGMEYSDICAITGASEEALYQRCSRALRKLRALLGGDFMHGEALESDATVRKAVAAVLFSQEQSD